MSAEQSRMVRIGLFTMVALAIMTLALMVVGRKAGYFRAYYRLIGEFSNVQGLKAGQPVWLSGVDVGLVESVSLSPKTEGNVRVILTIETAYRDFIRGDSRAILDTKGLLGDKIVNITMGSPVSAPLEHDDYILTSPPVELGDMMEQVGAILNSVGTSLSRVEEVVAGLADGEGTIGKLVNDTTLHDESVTMLKNLNTVLSDIKQARGTLGKLINDQQLYQRLDNIVADIEGGKGTLGKLLTSDEIHTHLVEAAASVDTLFANAATGDGSVGKIMMKDDLHDAVVDLLKDIKANPDRYINVSVFGGRDKRK